MLHHISFGVSDIERSAAFYDAVLAPLGYIRVWHDLSLARPTKPSATAFLAVATSWR